MHALIHKEKKYVCMISDKLSVLWNYQRDLAQIYNLPNSSWTTVKMSKEDVERYYKREAGTLFYLNCEDK